MHPDWRRICDEYMTATSYTREGYEEWWEGRNYDRENRPETYLTYPDAEVVIDLGKPTRPSVPDFWNILEGRPETYRMSTRALIAIPLFFQKHFNRAIDFLVG